MFIQPNLMDDFWYHIKQVNFDRLKDYLDFNFKLDFKQLNLDQLIFYAIVGILNFLSLCFLCLLCKKVESIPIKTLLLPEVRNFISDIDKYYKSFNPTLYECQDKVYYIYRVAYGEIFNPRKTLTDWRGKFIKYPSKLCLYDGLKPREIVVQDITFYYPEFNSIKYRLTGYEDPRVVVLKDLVYIFVSCFANSNKYIQVCMIVIPAKIKDTADKILPVDVKLLEPSFNQQTYQKNWMPFVHDNDIYLVFDTKPLIILKCNSVTGEVKHIDRTMAKTQKIGSIQIRGGAIVRYDENLFLSIAHIRRGMYYTQIFYLFDTNWKILGFTDEFVIRDDKLEFVKNKTFLYFQIKVQFASGILIKGNQIIVSYGEGNVRSKLFFLDLNLLQRKIKWEKRETRAKK